MRSLALPLVAAVTVLLVGCSSAPRPPVPSPTPTVAAEPTTLEELGKAVVAEGLVDMANLYLIGGTSGSLAVQLFWTGEVDPGDQLDAFTEVSTRVDDVLEKRPEVTQVAFSALRGDGENAVVGATYDPGADVLLELLKTVADTACSTATLDNQDRGEGPRATVELGCKVAASDAAGLAAGYDEITAIHPDVEGIEVTRWKVSLTDRPTTDADLRLDVGPIEGRQQLFVELMSMAVAGGADQLTLIDTGSAVSVIGFADASQAGLCATMVDRIYAAGVERASVSLQLRDTTPEAWGCRVVP